jgi:hypothetical protein
LDETRRAASRKYMQFGAHWRVKDTPDFIRS